MTNKSAIKFSELELRMAELAKRDGDIFLPNTVPEGAAKYFFICMEPSLSLWGGKHGELAQDRLENGFKNFLWGWDCQILHYTIQKYLLKSGERYHITDISKGAMLVESAEHERLDRYRRWFPLLLEEIELLAAPGARFFAVGNAVSNCLIELGFPFPFSRVIHYSGQAAGARKKSIAGKEVEFQEFRSTISTDSILSNAVELLSNSGMSVELQQTIKNSLSRGKLTESRAMLAFEYRNQFQLSSNV